MDEPILDRLATIEALANHAEQYFGNMQDALSELQHLMDCLQETINKFKPIVNIDQK